MDQAIEKLPRLRRTQIQIEQLLEEFSKSGLQITPFCAHHKITSSTFHKWQNRYGKKAGNMKLKAFAEIKVVTPDVSVEQLFAEVHGVKLYQPVAASYLKELARL